MMTYILEKKRLFLILLQTLAVFCQFNLAYADSIFPRAKLGAQPSVQLIPKKSAAAQSAAYTARQVAPKAASKSAKAKRVETGACPQILMAKHKGSPNDFISLPEKEFVECETTASNVPSPAFVDPVLGSQAAAAAKTTSGSPSASTPEKEFSLDQVFKVLAEADKARQKYES
ncbi:MAG: hypothetical protein AABZ31_05815, partial [Bdellovibrionota bacterium]